MKRRQFLAAAGLAGGVLLTGGGLWGRAVWARQQLTQRLRDEARSGLAPKREAELASLPAQARGQIQTWFHGPCLNAAEFAYELCSRSFAEKHSACRSPELKEHCILNAFTRKVVSETEILHRVRVIAEEIGAQLDRNWTTSCQRIASRWDSHLEPYGTSMPNDFVRQIEPAVRRSLLESIQRAKVAGERPALSETAIAIGQCALLALRLRSDPRIAIPVFVVAALGPIIAYVSGQRRHQPAEYQAALSERMALLGGRIGTEFESEVRTRLTQLHGWQEQALHEAAEFKARETIHLI